MALLERFRDATFANYEPQTPGQAEALQVEQTLVTEWRLMPSWTE